jgi:hypothetical protein
LATQPRLTGFERWERETYARTPERDALFETISGEPVKAERGSSAHPGFTSVNAAGRNTATLTLTGDTLTWEHNGTPRQRPASTIGSSMPPSPLLV